MQLAAPALQQRIVCGVPHEGVTERVDGVGGDPAHRHDLGVDDPIEMAPEEIGVESGHGAEQGVGELPAHDRRHLCQLLRGPERVEPGHQRVVQGHGNIEVLPSLRIDDGLGELLGEQRDAVGALGEEIEERRRRGRHTLGGGSPRAPLAATRETTRRVCAAVRRCNVSWRWWARGRHDG